MLWDPGRLLKVAHALADAEWMLNSHPAGEI